jgi:hypothetical protein
MKVLKYILSQRVWVKGTLFLGAAPKMDTEKGGRMMMDGK